MAKRSQRDIVGLIPHRFENVLIDEVECTDAGASGVLTIAEHDPAGRDIFARTDGPQPAVLEHALAEHLALASLCQLGCLVSVGKSPERGQRRGAVR